MGDYASRLPVLSMRVGPEERIKGTIAFRIDSAEVDEETYMAERSRQIPILRERILYHQLSGLFRGGFGGL